MIQCIWRWMNETRFQTFRQWKSCDIYCDQYNTLVDAALLLILLFTSTYDLCFYYKLSIDRRTRKWLWTFAGTDRIVFVFSHGEHLENKKQEQFFIPAILGSLYQYGWNEMLHSEDLPSISLYLPSAPLNL